MENKKLSLFFIFPIVFDLNFCFVLESDNIARNGRAYQASTENDQTIAKFAVSDPSLIQFNVLPENAPDWWGVSLNGIYQVTEICLWNGYSPSK